MTGVLDCGGEGGLAGGVEDGVSGGVVDSLRKVKTVKKKKRQLFDILN